MVSEKVKFTNPSRHKQTVITRLRFGKCLTADTLYLLNMKANNLCDTCYVEEDVKHYLMECQKYVDSQVTRNDALQDAEITTSLGNMLGDERCHDVLYQYVIDTQREL